MGLPGLVFCLRLSKVLADGTMVEDDTYIVSFVTGKELPQRFI